MTTKTRIDENEMERCDHVVSLICKKKILPIIQYVIVVNIRVGKSRNGNRSQIIFPK